MPAILFFLGLAGMIALLVLLKLKPPCTWRTFACLLGLILIAGLLACFVFGIAFLPGVMCVIILIVQFFRWVTADNGTAVSAAEKERILQMVEQGKITTEESTELLETLGRTNALRGQDKFSKPDIAMLCGVALVVLGFFLPWIYLSWRAYLAGVESGIYQADTWQSGTHQAGHHVGAIGWAILIIGILSAILLFVTPQNFLYKISMLQIFLAIIGTVLVISVLVRAGGDLGPGIICCLVGFILGIVASTAKLKKLSA